MTIDKRALRSSARQLRDQIAIRFPDAGQQLADRFPMRLLERFGPVVSGYVAIGSEIDPAQLMKRLAAAGAEICMPRVEDDDSMTFRSVPASDVMEAGPFGLTQPSASAPLASPTLVLAPMLAFDASGNRLGYGKGHYDRALAQLKNKGRAFVCGLAFAEQEVVAIPAEKTDVPLDWVVTPERSIPLFLSRV